jgi:hypothetical protein
MSGKDWNRSRCRKRTGRARNKSVRRTGKRSSPKFGKDRNGWRTRSSSMRDRSTNRSGKENSCCRSRNRSKSGKKNTL